MKMNEKNFIKKLLPLTKNNVYALKLEDDIAKIADDIILNTDTTIEGVHILSGLNPKFIAYKAMARAYSDILAKGGEVVGYFTNIILPKKFTKYDELIQGFYEFISIYKMDLLGGDTSTHDAENIIIVVTIVAKIKKSIPRSNAKVGDFLYLTKKIGSAYLGFLDCQNANCGTKNAIEYLMPSLARIDDFSEVNASMDISDGLIIDAQKMAEASKKRIVIDFLRLPFAKSENYKEMLAFGDDYNILLSSSKEIKNGICVGFVKEGEGVDLQNFPFEVDVNGYDHFFK